MPSSNEAHRWTPTVLPHKQREMRHPPRTSIRSPTGKARVAQLMTILDAALR